MLFLAIETSSLSGGLALFADGVCLGRTVFEAGPDRGRELLSRLRELLRQAGAEVGSLDAVCVGRGPGSYTGIRIGVTAAKTLSFALRIPVLPISSLEVMAAGALPAFRAGAPPTEIPPTEPVSPGEPPSPAPGRLLLATLLDGRQDFVYGGLFAVDCAQDFSPLTARAGLERRMDDCVATVSEVARAMEVALASEIAADRVLRVQAVGDGAEKFLHSVGELSSSVCVFERGAPTLDVPRADVLGFLAHDAASAAVYDAALTHALAPAYLRATEAERRRSLGK